MLHELAVVAVVVEKRKFLDEDEILFAERTALEAKAEVQRPIPTVQETSALGRQAEDPYYWVQRSMDQ